MIELESERLLIRELSENDLAAILPVLLSNEAFLLQQEGSEGEPGRYDLARWQRDWHITQFMPGSHALGCFLKPRSEAVGYIGYLEENEDGQPWLGVLVIDAAHQRQGLGTEVFQRLAQYFRVEYAWPVLHAGTAQQNQTGLAFLQALGFRPYKTVANRLASGLQDLTFLELAL
ncbi:MAG TPA: GNAT family protein [Ktedonobacteraceae bacterium]|nr:GNAT family protein [Ktedonobacteraceae bacterium]